MKNYDPDTATYQNLPEPWPHRQRQSPVVAAISIPPSDRPAAEYPEYEPTPQDLAAIEGQDDIAIEHRLVAAATLAAYEQRHRELLDLRAALSPLALTLDEDDDEDDLSAPAHAA
ncbi:MAG: hypothetical protein ACQEXM_26980 [Actinomycetota bacterium]